MYKPTLALVFVLSLLVPSLPYADAELLPRQAGANGATAQLSLLSTADQSSSSMMSSMSTTMMTSSMSMTPASVSASASMASASASVAGSAAASVATNAATGGGGGSGAQGLGGASNNSAAVGRVAASWGLVGALVGVVVGWGVL
ncbi:hypothetical protein MMC17_007455 [Xylographa soralifera]|nr:hypothetical protein [Xylographa soralifera]